jgi:hypothetical protein
MIIIKSQDGSRIREYDEIFINGSEIGGAKDCFDSGGSIYGDNWLGTYETEERAKEVIEMIEERIKKININDFLKNIICLDENPDDSYKRNIQDVAEELAIFTMPKE